MVWVEGEAVLGGGGRIGAVARGGLDAVVATDAADAAAAAGAGVVRRVGFVESEHVRT